MGTDANPVEVIPGLTIDRARDGKITCVTVSNSTRQVIDAFVEFIKEMQQHRSADEISYFLFDFSDSPAGFHTPYGRARMEELLQWRTELVAYTAILLPKNFIVHIARAYLESIHQERLTHRLFSQREEGLAWLEELVKSHARLF
ncbi:MAG: hypothetical protein KF716_05375 [Anaerolineae bacterium]|nr:hypothetical protein [Anaerolineae bacterium]